MLLKIGVFFVFTSVLLAVTLGDGTQDTTSLPQYPPQPPLPNGTITNSTSSTSSTSTTSTTSSTTTTSSTSLPPTNTTTSTSTTTTTTTEVPPTVPPAVAGKWRVEENNVTCLMADLAIQIVVAYENNNKTKQEVFDVPSNASSASSMCGNGTQILELIWSSSNQNVNNSLIFTFSKNDSKKHYDISNITLQVLTSESKNTSWIFHHDVPEFSTPVSKSYRCAKDQDIKLTNSDSNTTVATLKINNVQFEAFHEKKNDDKFSVAEDCASSSSPDIVPIAVGCALVGLVAIVLIAYLVGRRRSQARGYLSM